MSSSEDPILQAAADGDLEKVTLLIEQGANVFVSRSVHSGGVNSKSFHPPLFLAIKADAPDVVFALIDAGATRCDHSFFNRSLMCVAASEGACKVIAALAERGHDVDESSGSLSARPPLYYAAENNHPLAISTLLNLDAHVDGNPGCSSNTTPLTTAAAHGHLECVKLLVDAGAELATDAHLGHPQSPLASAAAAGHLHVLRFLADAGADVHFSPIMGRTPLVHAAFNNHKAIVRVLVEKYGVDVDASPRMQPRALDVAAKADHPSMVSLLVELGADVNMHYPGWTTLVHVASTAGPETIRALIDAGALIDGRDNKGSTALMVAANAARTESVSILLDAGADPNDSRDNGQSALAFANGQQTVHCLIEAGGDINSLDDWWRHQLASGTF